MVKARVSPIFRAAVRDIGTQSAISLADSASQEEIIDNSFQSFASIPLAFLNNRKEQVYEQRNYKTKT